MSDEDLLKIVIGVTSAFAGWILAQLTSGLKTWLQRHKLLKLLLEELGDLDTEINRLYFFYARQLEIHGAMGVSSESAAGLSNPIYRNYYKDALLSLNKYQRISYQMIHSLVDLVNIGITDLRQMSSEIYAKNVSSGMTKELTKSCDAWGKAARAQFQNCASLQWQIRFHLQNKKAPDLRPHTKHHEKYLVYLQDAQRKAEEFITNGKTIDRDKFDQMNTQSTSTQNPT